MLPEHKARIVQYKHESEMDRLMAKHKQKRPTRDEFELEELGNQLVEAKDEESEVSLTVWGESDQVVGRITVLDARTRLVHVESQGILVKIPFLDIMKVGSIG
ncbi:YolD-like family protein [Paenibacillus sp. GCM10012303]|uniref:YolD-like family protein n=1 Tax=Paenibacillus sp. GCM10012303 TaxID=3317340 RepID=UPI00361BB047